jgi:hypothetical protein
MGLLAVELHCWWATHERPLGPSMVDFVATGLPLLPVVPLLLMSPTWELAGELREVFLSHGNRAGRFSKWLVVGQKALGQTRAGPAVFRLLWLAPEHGNADRGTISSKQR